MRDNSGTGADYFYVQKGATANTIYLKNGGNVGIGTSNPSCKLHVNGDVALNDLYGYMYGVGGMKRIFGDVDDVATFGDSDEVGYPVAVHATGSLQVYSPSTQFVYPDATTTFNYNTVGRLSVENSNITANNYSTVQFNNGTVNASGIYGRFLERANNSGTLNFWTRDAAGSPHDRMTIKEDGKIGIGVTDPAYGLHVNGTGYFETGEDEDAFSVYNGPNGIFQFRVDGGNNNTYLQENGGYVGIGTSVPLGVLHIYQSTNAAADFYVQNDNVGALAKTAFSIGNAPVSTPYDGLFCEHYGTGWTTSGIKIASGSSVQSGSGSPGGSLIGTGHASADLKFLAGGSAGGIKMILKPSGNLGIGITNPHQKLEVVGTMQSTGGLIELNDSSNYGVKIATGSSTGTVDVGTGATVQSLNFGTGPAAKTVVIGSQATTSATTIHAGSSGILGIDGNLITLNGHAYINNDMGNTLTEIGTGNTTGAINLGGTSTPINIGSAGTGTVTIGGPGNQTIGIGNNISGAHTISIGNSASTGSVGISGGSYGIIATTTGKLDLIGGSSIDLNTSQTYPTNIGAGNSTGTITIGSSGAQVISVGSNSAGAKTISIGNTIAGGSVNIKSPVPGINVPFYARLTGNVTTSSTSLVDITGLSILLVNNAVYEFEANLLTASTTNDGVKYGINYSSTGAAVFATITGTMTLGVGATGELVALNPTASPVFCISSSITAGGILIKGTMTTGANAGTVTIQQLKVVSGTASCFSGSFFKVTRIS